MEEELKKTSRSVVVELTKTLRSVVEELMNWSLIHLELLVVVVVGHSTWEQPWEQQPLERQPLEQQPLDPRELLKTGTSTVVHCWKKPLAYPSLRLVYSSGSSLP